MAKRRAMTSTTTSLWIADIISEAGYEFRFDFDRNGKTGLAIL